MLIVPRDLCVFGVANVKKFSGPQGQRLKAGAAEAPHGRRGQDLFNRAKHIFSMKSAEIILGAGGKPRTAVTLFAGERDNP